ncbi:RNA polymerase sigma-70 factor [Fodinibius sp.]|uniref:RNA polymerase sigma factor n=1 Tax=Fodinibius sp. TaxID=1872440 RepID=UPI002ACE4D8C|nr:RNA polymerase sigma-70 factor [Fodinibius sp.]MDZ7657765.1 RNA polymerase sigma-70 factor [Fodinibius sp.]
MIDPASVPLVLFALATAPAKKADEAAIAQKIKEGNHDAFKNFYDLHYDSLFRFLVSKNTSPENAKDLIQKAFIYIWEHREQIDPQKSLRAYIFQIAYTRMLNHHRDNKKFNVEEAVPEQQTSHTPEDSAQASDLKRLIDQAIEDMPEKRGTVFQLCFIDDFTYKEAAEALEVSPKTIENHMGLALKDMREYLKNFQNY